MPSHNFSFDAVPEVFDLLALRGDLPIPSRIEPVTWPAYTRDINVRCDPSRCLACDETVSKADQHRCFKFCGGCYQRLDCEAENELTAQLCARVSLVCRNNYRVYRWTACEWRPLCYMNVDVRPDFISKPRILAKVPLRFMEQYRYTSPPTYCCSVPGKYLRVDEDTTDNAYRSAAYDVDAEYVECYITVGTMKLPVVKPFIFSVSSIAKKDGEKVIVHCKTRMDDADMRLNDGGRTTQAQYEMMWLLSYTAPANWWECRRRCSAENFRVMRSGVVTAEGVRDTLCSLSFTTEVDRVRYNAHFEPRRQKCAQRTQEIVDAVTTEALPLLDILRKRKRRDVTTII